LHVEWFVTEIYPHANDYERRKVAPERLDAAVVALQHLRERIAPEGPPSRPGATEWSHIVQRVSASCPIEELTDDEVKELHGAATFLRDYCQGEVMTRGKPLPVDERQLTAEPE
jgi:hypothetical protein